MYYASMLMKSCGEICLMLYFIILNILVKEQCGVKKQFVQNK